MSLVAGVDSSTQSCKVVVRDAESGVLVRKGRASHPSGTEVDPHAWWVALVRAVDAAGGIEDVAAVAVAAQQHGMVCLTESGEVVRPALLWNDARSAEAAAELIADLGGGEKGRRAWAEAVGLVPMAFYTVTKLRWLADHDMGSAARTAAVCLPHDWLTWRLRGCPGIGALVTDRGDASGTGYWSAATGRYRMDLLRRALGRDATVPRVLSCAEPAGWTAGGAVLGPGTGDNAAAALGVGAGPGDVIASIGTSGVVSAIADVPAVDPAGAVAGFADATGRFLPTAATLNAARVLDAAARVLGVDHDTFSTMALSAPAGCDGLVVVPHLVGEPATNPLHQIGVVRGLTLATSTPAYLARATVEGVLCGLADALDALIAHGVRLKRLLLVGGGARSQAIREIAPTIFGYPVTVHAPAEYAASGAARQAAWTLTSSPEPPRWGTGPATVVEAEHVPAIRSRFAEVCDGRAFREGR